MNKTQVSPSLESHTEEPLWQEFTEQEQEKICGGAYWTDWQNRSNRGDAFTQQNRYTRFWVTNNQCRPQTKIVPWNAASRRTRWYWGW
ncbi:MAG: hypothetical protein ACRCU2_08405 [Planktothrix sp.]